MATTRKKPVTKAQNENVPVANKDVVDKPVPQPGPANWWRKLLFFLQLRDGFWSAPVAFFLYVMVGSYISWQFGYTTGTYDPSFIQPVLLTAAVMLAFSTLTGICMWLNFRHTHRYGWGKHKVNPVDGNIIKNYSKEDWNEKLTAWERIKVTMFIYFAYLFLSVVVYIKMI